MVVMHYLKQEEEDEIISVMFLALLVIIVKKNNQIFNIIQILYKGDNSCFERSKFVNNCYTSTFARLI